MSTFDAELLPALTREHIPELAGESDLRVEALAQDGSDRAYYRVTRADGAPTGYIVMHFDTERAENLSFAPLTRFLQSIGAPCPRLHAADDDLHLLWLEDLGGEDLYGLAGESWEDRRRPLYESALRDVAHLHALTPEKLAAAGSAPACEFQPPFDEALYHWEQDYFFKNFAAHFSAASPDKIAAVRRDPFFADLASHLASFPRALVHRDFQSRNVLLQGERTVLIDYQGMRFGRPEYDLASLVFDPYVPIEPAQREALFALHRDHLASLPGAPALNDEVFLQCAAQRLMQALGAFGFLGIVKQKRHFLASVTPGVQSLLSVVDLFPPLEILRPILELKN